MACRPCDLIKVASVGLFEFLLVILGILLSLGLTELLGGVVRIIQGELRSSKLHTLWIVIVFQLQVQLAWGLWGLRSRASWRYPEFLLLLSGPIVLYLAAAVLFPSSGAESAEAHLLRQRRPFFLLNASYVVVTALYGGFLFTDGWGLGPNIVRLIVIAVLVTLASTTRRAVQWALGLLILAGNLFWTYQYVFVVAATPSGQ